MRIVLNVIISLFLCFGCATNAFAGVDLCAELFGGPPAHNEKDQRLIVRATEMADDLLSKIKIALGGNTNPYATAYSLESQIAIRDRLLVRYDQNHNLISFKDRNDVMTFAAPTAQIRDTNFGVSVQTDQIDWKLISNVMHDAKLLLISPNQVSELKRLDLLSAQWGLRLLKEYLKKFVNLKMDPQHSSLMQQEGESDTTQEASTQDIDIIDSGASSSEEPEDIEGKPKDYAPHTKDTEKKGKGDHKKTVAAEVNFDASYFRIGVYNGVTRGRPNAFYDRDLPGQNTAIGSHSPTRFKMKVNLAKKTLRDLVLPSGYEPLQSEDPRVKITLTKFGTYVIETNMPIEQADIPLRPKKLERLDIEDLEILTEKVGYSSQDWPDKLRAAIINRIDPKRPPQEIAKLIETHLQHDYLYSVDKRPEKDPIAALKSGKFQCDMAAYMMVSLLRDTYKIPSRVVFGYRAKAKVDQPKDFSYLVKPAEGHAWIEIYADGKWIEFDPTPRKPDRIKKEETSDSEEFKNKEEENSSAPPKENTDQTQPGESVDSKQQQSHDQKLKQNSDKGAQEAQNNIANSDKPEPGKNELDLEELNRELDIGSLSMKPDKNRNPLTERTLRVLLQHALWPKETVMTLTERLNRIGDAVKYSTNTHVKNLYSRARQIFTKKEGRPEDILTSLAASVRSQSVNKTYDQVNGLLQRLLLFNEVMDQDSSAQILRELTASLKRILDRIKALNHQDSGRVSAVEEFLKPLDSITRNIIRDTYFKRGPGEFEHVGFNQATYQLADDLASGKLNDYRLMGTVSNLVDFILDTDPQLEYITIKLLEEDLKRRMGTDMLPTKLVADIYRSVHLQAHKSAYENYMEGTSFVPVRRRQVDIPGVIGKGEPETINQILYDTSGSMINDPADLQAAIIAAFVGKGMSRRSPVTGKPLARNILMGFDEEVHTIHRVLSDDDAKDIIQNYRTRLKNTEGDTNIQLAIEKALLEIIAAQKEPSRRDPLARANIIVMTDGEADLDLDRLRALRKQIDPRTPVQIMFIAINGSNPKLMEFSLESGKAGFDRGFYRQFTLEHVKELVAESRAPVSLANDTKRFHSDRPAKELSGDIESLLVQAMNEARSFQISLGQAEQRINSTREWTSRVHGLPIPQHKPVDRDIEKWIMEIRGQIASQPLYKDRRLGQILLDDLLRNWETLTGVKFKDLSLSELESLKHFVEELQH